MTLLWYLFTQTRKSRCGGSTLQNAKIYATNTQRKLNMYLTVFNTYLAVLNTYLAVLNAYLAVLYSIMSWFLSLLETIALPWRSGLIFLQHTHRNHNRSTLRVYHHQLVFTCLHDAPINHRIFPHLPHMCCFVLSCVTQPERGARGIPPSYLSWFEQTILGNVEWTQFIIGVFEWMVEECETHAVWRAAPAEQTHPITPKGHLRFMRLSIAVSWIRRQTFYHAICTDIAMEHINSVNQRISEGNVFIIFSGHHRTAALCMNGVS